MSINTSTGTRFSTILKKDGKVKQLKPKTPPNTPRSVPATPKNSPVVTPRKKENK